MSAGWLEAPDQREIRCYGRDAMSIWKPAQVFTVHGLPLPGEPAVLKRRRLVLKDAVLIE